MAPSHFLVPAFALLIALVPATSIAREIIVGDEAGWRPGFDYETWARGLDFHLGDTLIFNYQRGTSNIYEVSASEFQTCTYPPDTTPYQFGRDRITLTSVGPVWYICGVGQNCAVGGQKLFIMVKP